VRRGAGMCPRLTSVAHNVGNGPWLQLCPTSSDFVWRLGYPEAGPQNQGDQQAGRESLCRNE
jgi:hypothetical protein